MGGMVAAGPVSLVALVLPLLGGDGDGVGPGEAVGVRLLLLNAALNDIFFLGGS